MNTSINSRTLNTPPARNAAYFTLGSLALLANKLRYTLRGYRNPRPFPNTEYARAIAYDLGVVDAWMARLANYLGQPYALTGKTVLELGPGADLGVGLYFLAQGVARYCAADVNPLAAMVPQAFYERLVAHLVERGTITAEGADSLLAEPESTRVGRPDRLDYRCLANFDLLAFGRDSVDLIVSQAAFEHFENFPATARQMAAVARPGALLVTEIDLNTHTRWLRDNDPHSIYRIPEWLYRLCHFPGIPNRMRPNEYVQALEQAGWIDIVVTPITVVSDDYLHQVQSHLATPFRTAVADMSHVHVVLCARRAG
jgi:SAM-dependent methyltransferase